MSQRLLIRNTVINLFQISISIFISILLSRKVLAVLGIIDFGINNVVAGLSTMFVFINTSMAVAIQRHLSYELGRKNVDGYNSIYKTSIFLHRIIACIALVFSELIGLVLLFLVLDIPIDRMYAAFWVFQSTLFSFSCTILMVPYQAVLLSKESMLPVAVISVFIYTFQLFGVITIEYFPYDKLILFASVIFLSNFCALGFYVLYIKYKYRKLGGNAFKDTAQIKSLLSFSGWNLAGAISLVLKNQGISVVLNIFYGPIINAATGIANQVVAALVQVSQTIQKATNPRIIKLYSSQMIREMDKLVVYAVRATYYLQLLVALPIFINISKVLTFWLGTVPEYSPLIIRFLIINSLIESLSFPFMSVIQASGKIKRYQIIISIIISANIPISVLLLSVFNNYTFVYVNMIFLTLIAIVFRVYYISQFCNSDVVDKLLWVFIRIVATTIILFVISFFVTKYLELNLFASSLCTILTTLLLVFIIDLNKPERNKIVKHLSRRMII